MRCFLGWSYHCGSLRLLPEGAPLKVRQVYNKSGGSRFKRTPQRLAILDYLEGNKSHPSAEDIFRSVARKYQSLSFATVYNTLNMLAKTGALRELTIDPARKRYDPDISSHNHLICVTCGRIVDIPDVFAIDLPAAMAHDFTLLGSHVELYGLCAACNKKKSL